MVAGIPVLSPFHAGRDIPPGLLGKICADIQMPAHEFVK